MNLLGRDKIEEIDEKIKRLNVLETHDISELSPNEISYLRVKYYPRFLREPHILADYVLVKGYSIVVKNLDEDGLVYLTKNANEELLRQLVEANKIPEHIELCLQIKATIDEVTQFINRLTTAGYNFDDDFKYRMIAAIRARDLRNLLNRLNYNLTIDQLPKYFINGINSKYRNNLLINMIKLYGQNVIILNDDISSYLNFNTIKSNKLETKITRECIMCIINKGKYKIVDKLINHGNKNVDEHMLTYFEGKNKTKKQLTKTLNDYFDSIQYPYE